jgi:hypothetical protein
MEQSRLARRAHSSSFSSEVTRRHFAAASLRGAVRGRGLGEGRGSVRGGLKRATCAACEVLPRSSFVAWELQGRNRD